MLQNMLPAAISMFLVFAVFPRNSLAREAILFETERGVVFSPEEASAQHRSMPVYLALPPFWAPTKADIKYIEKNLLTYISKKPSRAQIEILNRFKDYRFQYIGETHKNRRVVAINAFCDDETLDKRWRQGRPVMMLDGGTCYFFVHFDPVNRRFFDFSHN